MNERKETAATLVGKCADSVKDIKERLGKVASSVSLTNYALKVHKDLEDNTKEAVEPFKGRDPQNAEYLALASIETILPDFVIGAAL